MELKQYSLIVLMPSLLSVLIVIFIAVFLKSGDLKLIGRWIARNAFSDVLKEKKKREDRTSRWLFQDIDLTSKRSILHRVWLATSLLFAGMFSGAMVMFWQLLLLEVSSVCDINDPSKDCFEITVWEMPKQDPINCSSAAVQNGTTYVLCYKIVFNLGSGHRCKLWSIQAVHVGLQLGFECVVDDQENQNPASITNCHLCTVLFCNGNSSCFEGHISRCCHFVK